MSTNLSQIDFPDDERDPDEILGGTFDDISAVNAHGEDPGTKVAIFVGRIRGMILSEMQRTGVTTSQMADRAGVSVSAMSRQLRSEGDLKASTAVILASALGKAWKVTWAASDVSASVRPPPICYDKTISTGGRIVGLWVDQNMSKDVVFPFGNWNGNAVKSVPEVSQLSEIHDSPVVSPSSSSFDILNDVTVG